MSCEHRGRVPDGKCEGCGAETCPIGVTGCRCAVGWPYDLQCERCRDKPNRIDQLYCACVPARMPPRAAEDPAPLRAVR